MNKLKFSLKNKDIKMKTIVFVSFILTFILMNILYILLKCAPFGNKSLASMDAEIQYLDFFAYYKDVIIGKNSIAYTFSKTLGGGMFGVWAYYLASPLNLLCIFFPKENLVSFFDLLVALKMSLCAATMSFYLKKRFCNIRNVFVILLSVCYAFCQYNIAQSSNIMWLDGVYMIPLILYGVYRLVHDKNICYLSFSVAISIMFNWYTGGINCLFSIIWLFFEILFDILEDNEGVNKHTFGYIVKHILRYGFAMLMGVFISSLIFVPTIFAFQGGRGSLNWQLIQNIFNGNVISVIQSYSLGAVSSSGTVALFCGSLPLLGCIGYFFDEKKTQRKLAMALLLVVSLMLYFWQPLNALFSLLREVFSYWHRYAYVSIFVIIYICASFLENWDSKNNKGKIVLKSSLIYAVVFMILNYVNNRIMYKNMYFTVAFIIIIASLLYCYDESRFKSKYILMMSLCLFLELLYNAKLLINRYDACSDTNFYDYTVAEQEQIQELKTYDSGLYRITQTSNRWVDGESNLTANYNEGLAYNYWSISGYTSDPDYIQTDFIGKLGYRVNSNTFCIINTSILPADSLLSTKYVLSEYPIVGLVEVSELGTYNNKKVYENPYCLPMAMIVEDYNIQNKDGLDAFQYQNALYSELLGEDISLYTPIEYDKETDSSGVHYTLQIPEGDYSIYGNIIWNSYMNARLNVNDYYSTKYSCWLSPTVFYVPVNEKENSADIQLVTSEVSIKEEMFYALNLDVLEKVTKKLQQQAVGDIEIENGYVKCNINGKSGQYVYLSVADDAGWTVLRNGEEIEPELFGDCLIMIPLEEGENEIVLKYHVSGMILGIALTVIGIVGVIVYNFIMRKCSKKNIIGPEILEESSNE